MPEVYSRQGFVRRDIESILKWEREAGVVQESTTFNSGNEEIPIKEPEVKHSPEGIKAVADDLRAAFASGEFTGGL